MSDEERAIIDKLIADGLIEPATETADGLEYNVLAKGNRKDDPDFITLQFFKEYDTDQWAIEKNWRDGGPDCVYDGDMDGADSYIRNDMD